MDRRLLLAASAVLLGATLTITLAERTSQCKVKCWFENKHPSGMKGASEQILNPGTGLLFNISCQVVQEKLVSQIKAWQIRYSCWYAGEKCSYELVSSAPYLITATHTSTATKKVSELQFLLEQSTICKVTGEAVSEFPTDPADNSTNYCSLQNLMDGSNLINAEGYKQFSNKWICPGFEEANCTLTAGKRFS